MTRNQEKEHMNCGKCLCNDSAASKGNAKTKKQFQLFQAGTDPLMWGRDDNMKKVSTAGDKSGKRSASTQDGGDILDDEEIEELPPLSGDINIISVILP